MFCRGTGAHTDQDGKRIRRAPLSSRPSWVPGNTPVPVGYRAIKLVFRAPNARMRVIRPCSLSLPRTQRRCSRARARLLSRSPSRVRSRSRSLMHMPHTRDTPSRAPAARRAETAAAFHWRWSLQVGLLTRQALVQTWRLPHARLAHFHAGRSLTHEVSETQMGIHREGRLPAVAAGRPLPSGSLPGGRSEKEVGYHSSQFVALWLWMRPGRGSGSTRDAASQGSRAESGGGLLKMMT